MLPNATIRWTMGLRHRSAVSHLAMMGFLGLVVACVLVSGIFSGSILSSLGLLGNNLQMGTHPLKIPPYSVLPMNNWQVVKH